MGLAGEKERDVTKKKRRRLRNGASGKVRTTLWKVYPFAEGEGTNALLK